MGLDQYEYDQHRQKQYEEEMQSFENERAIEAHLKIEQRKLKDQIPEWRNPATQQAELAEMVNYAKKLGWTEQQINSVYAASDVVILREAMLNDKAKKAKAQKVKKKTKAKPKPKAKAKAKPKTTKKLAKPAKA